MQATTTKRILSFIALSIVLLIGSVISHYGIIPWTHSSLTHSMLQSIATVIAFFVGVAALYRYYTVDVKTNIKSNMLLFIGVGFLGTSVVDLYHTTTTTMWFAATFPEVPSTVARWSWLATRMILSIMLLLSLVGTVLEKRGGKPIKPSPIYTIMAALTILVLVFFMSVPIPYPVHPQDFFSRPVDVVPGIIFLITLIGYLIEGSWKTDDFTYWLVLCLIASVFCQFAYIGLSKVLFDNMYHSAHIVKILSYAFVYLGITGEQTRVNKARQEALDKSMSTE